MNDQDPNDPETHVSTRMAFLMIEMLRLRGVDARAVVARLPTFGSLDAPNPYISWADYVLLMEQLLEEFGSAKAMCDAIKALQKSAYSEIRALAGFFPSLLPFYVFVNQQLMAEMSPAVQATTEVLSDRRVRTHAVLREGVRSCQTYWDGTIALAEIFPWHADFDVEAKVTVAKRTDRELIMDIELPVDARKESFWGALRHRVSAPSNAQRLTDREQEVLDLLVQGLTNGQIAARLGTASGTVKNQISSILGKMDAVNRTELAARVART